MEHVWDSELDTGHGNMDRDHKRMVVLINHLADGIENEKGSEFFDLMLNELMRQANEHFAAEEQLMALQHYPSMTTHKAEHALLIKQAKNLKEWFAWGSTAAAQCSSLLEFFEYSLVIHILSADKCLSDVADADEPIGRPEAAESRARVRLQRPA